MFSEYALRFLGIYFTLTWSDPSRKLHYFKEDIFIGHFWETIWKGHHVYFPWVTYIAVLPQVKCVRNSNPMLSTDVTNTALSTSFQVYRKLTCLLPNNKYVFICTFCCRTSWNPKVPGSHWVKPYLGGCEKQSHERENQVASHHSNQSWEFFLKRKSGLLAFF